MICTIKNALDALLRSLQLLKGTLTVSDPHPQFTSTHTVHRPTCASVLSLSQWMSDVSWKYVLPIQVWSSKCLSGFSPPSQNYPFSLCLLTVRKKSIIFYQINFKSELYFQGSEELLDRGIREASSLSLRFLCQIICLSKVFYTQVHRWFYQFITSFQHMSLFLIWVNQILHVGGLTVEDTVRVPFYIYIITSDMHYPSF